MTAFSLSSFQIFLLLVFFQASYASSDQKPHGHKGLLKAYNGQQIGYAISKHESDMLDSGKPVVYSDKASGRGLVIQDVNAPPAVCMEKILDMKNYDKYVAQVKKVFIYKNVTLQNGTVSVGARFDVSALTMGFRYWLALTYEPKFNTLTWTLDYNFNSDFDDNIGHWQVMNHPTKKGWTRVLYSCQLRLFSWIPDFIVKYLIKTALIESTTWVTKEAEITARSESPNLTTKQIYPVKGCYVYNGSGFKYYIDSSFGRCPPGPKAVVVTSVAPSDTAEPKSSAYEVWALWLALASILVCISPHRRIRKY